MGLKDTGPLLDVIRPRRQVKGYIYGHTHRWQVEQDPSGLHLINLPPVAYVMEKTNPSGWVQANIEKNVARLQLHCLDSTHKAHGELVRLKWRA